MYKHLIIADWGYAQLITIHRPEALNALNLEVFRELKEHLIFISDQPQVRCLLITGSGEKAFVAGADISEFKSITPGGAKSFLTPGNSVMDMIEKYHIPVIALVNGFALGGGCELALACHIRIASEKARFGMPEINLGILPGYGGTQRLPRVVGKAKALEMILTGEMINAQEALSIGLVSHVVPDGTILEKGKELATKLSSKAPLSIQAIIKAIHASLPDHADGISVEGDLFTALADTSDFKEGTNAFLEKRKPVFTGK
jgi:enoyl-CoA hydratase